MITVMKSQSGMVLGPKMEKWPKPRASQIRAAGTTRLIMKMSISCSGHSFGRHPNPVAIAVEIVAHTKGAQNLGFRQGLEDFDETMG